eukprot:m.96260 g.96260  ORF g.96260 m.96260 type:complete len:246 (+) comp36899_c0_seq1:490-1227(+)
MMSYGLAIYFGPFFGHWLASTSTDSLAFAVASFGFLCLIPAAYLLPSSVGDRFLSSSLTAKSVFVLLFVTLLTLFPLSAFHSALPLIAKQHFATADHESDPDVGLAHAVRLLLVTVTQGVFIVLLSRWDERKLIQGSLAVSAIAFLILTFAQNVKVMHFCLAAIAVPQAIFAVTSISLLSKCGNGKVTTGVALGLSTSVNAFIQLLSPLGGSFLFNTFGYAAFGVVGLVVSLLGIAVIGGGIDDR